MSNSGNIECTTSGVFVAGTDTGVGKTIVAAGVARFLSRRGVRVGVMKPVATGVPPDEDAAFLMKAAAIEEPLERVSPFRFRDPLAPAVAADREGRQVRPEEILAARDRLLQRYSFLVVEGLGGVEVPLTWEYSVLELAAAFRMPLIIVGRAGLGTVNHTTLTVKAALGAGCSLAGVILVSTGKEPAGLAEQTNPKAIERWTGVPVLGLLPYLTPEQRRDPEELARRLAGPILNAPLWQKLEFGTANGR